jgi:hypothetical protein
VTYIAKEKVEIKLNWALYCTKYSMLAHPDKITVARSEVSAAVCQILESSGMYVLQTYIVCVWLRLHHGLLDPGDKGIASFVTSETIRTATQNNIIHNPSSH